MYALSENDIVIWRKGAVEDHDQGKKQLIKIIDCLREIF